MVKYRISFAAEEWQIRTVTERAKSLGITKSEYQRRLIDMDGLPEWGAGQSEDIGEWSRTRRAILTNPNLVFLLRALKREYDSKETSFPPSPRMKDFCGKHRLGLKELAAQLKRLCDSGVFIKEEDRRYTWTYKGILLFPEFAPLLDKEGGLVGGSVVGGLSKFFGDYDEFLDFVCSALQADKAFGESVIQKLLSMPVEYLVWMSDFVVPFKGLPDLNDPNSWRETSLTFLLNMSLLYLDTTPDVAKSARQDYAEIALRIASYKTQNVNDQSSN